MVQGISWEELLKQIADYWIAHELRLVQTPADIRDSLLSFNRDLQQHTEFAYGNLRSFTYWVYDPQSGLYGPNKFVGFCNMTIPKYALSQGINGFNSARNLRGHFNGGKTRDAIERATGKVFAGDSRLRAGLQTWAVSVLGIPDVFGGANHGKWEFLSLEG